MDPPCILISRQVESLLRQYRRQGLVDYSFHESAVIRRLKHQLDGKLACPALFDLTTRGRLSKGLQLCCIPLADFFSEYPQINFSPRPASFSHTFMHSSFLLSIRAEKSSELYTMHLPGLLYLAFRVHGSNSRVVQGFRSTGSWRNPTPPSSHPYWRSHRQHDSISSIVSVPQLRL